MFTFLGDDLNEIRLWKKSYNLFPRFGLFWVSSQCICLFLLSWTCVCSVTYPACNAHAAYCHVAFPTVQYFSTLSHKRQDFQKKKKKEVIEHKMCILIFSTSFIWIISYSKKNSENYQTYNLVHLSHTNKCTNYIFII
jgi:hypothetical protein